jgi:MFS family permease
VTSLPRRAGLVLAVLLTATFMTTIDNTIVNVAIPAIRADLEASGGEIQLVVAAYLITYAVFLSPARGSATCSAIGGCSSPDSRSSASPRWPVASRPTHRY